MLTAAGSEPARRSWAFSYLGVALVVGAVASRPGPGRWRTGVPGRWALGALLAILTVGNLAAGRIGGAIGTNVASMPSQFLRMTLVGVGAGAVMLLLAPVFRRWMGSVR